jgi:transposase
VATKVTTVTVSAGPWRHVDLSPTSRLTNHGNGKLFLATPFYKGRLVIEQMFCRLKAFRRIATRYDRSARNFLSALCLAATVCYWL